MREAAARKRNETAKTWISFDGPLDPDWVESLNSALDDNKLLCLASGERISLPDSLAFFFEVTVGCCALSSQRPETLSRASLKSRLSVAVLSVGAFRLQNLGTASPATVSRCGIVFVEEGQLDCEALLRAWKEGFEKQRNRFADLAHEIENWALGLCRKGLEFLRCNSRVEEVGWIFSQSALSSRMNSEGFPPLPACKRPRCERFCGSSLQTCQGRPSRLRLNESFLVSSVCRLLSALLSSGSASGGLSARVLASGGRLGPEESKRLARMWVCLAVAWGLGSASDEGERAQFWQCLREDLLSVSADLHGLASEGFSVFDLAVDEASLSYKPFSDALASSLAEQGEDTATPVAAPTAELKGVFVATASWSALHFFLLRLSTASRQGLWAESRLLCPGCRLAEKHSLVSCVKNLLPSGWAARVAVRACRIWQERRTPRICEKNQ